MVLLMTETSKQAPEVARDDDVRIGGYVAELRKGAGLSQAQLAERMRALGWKWSQQSCWSIEKGRQSLRLAEASDLASVLGIEMWQMLPFGMQDIEGMRDDMRAMRLAHLDLTHAVDRYETIRRRLALEVDNIHRPVPPSWRADIVMSSGQSALSVVRGHLHSRWESMWRKRPATASGPIAELYFESWGVFDGKRSEA